MLQNNNTEPTYKSWIPHILLLYDTRSDLVDSVHQQSHMSKAYQL